MAHKVHPKIFRVKSVEDWDSRWLERKKFPQYLEGDFRIREFLKEKIGKMGVEKIEIERFRNKVLVIIYTARPGLLIGRGGEGIEILRKALEKKLLKDIPKVSLKNVKNAAKERKELKIEVREVKDPWASAALSAQWIAQQIEKRVAHKRVLKQALSKIMSSRQVKGARVEVAGRLGGTDIARRDWLKKGNLPRQTLRADIDYARAEAMCTYGTIGVKVWIYKGEKFE